jgi:hypothetical protein
MITRLLPVVLLLLCAEGRTCSQTGSGWVSLFNGRDLTGWKVLNGTARFTVTDGAIVGMSTRTTPNTFLATEEEYGDFILEYEARIDSGLNSGVQIRSRSTPEYRNGRVHGYQVELDPTPRAWTGGLYDESGRGWLYTLEENPAARTAFHHPGWNRFRVEAIGNTVRVWVNGIPTADIVDCITPRGFIALQVHEIGDRRDLEGKTVRFRALKIKTTDLDGEQTQTGPRIRQVSYLNNTLSEREKQDGWQLLWDGVSTAGWRGARSDRFPDRGWEINEGTLSVIRGTGGESTLGGDIVTVGKYGTFELEVDFRLTKGANSGIKYFVDTELNRGEGSAIGCEYQILDDEFHPDAKEGTGGNRTLASLYDLIPADGRYYVPTESVKKRVNIYDWNRARIVTRGTHVEHYLNGIKVVEYERGTLMWRALVARSKYAVWPAFGEAREGHILLQDHGDAVSFRNIKIRTLRE